MSSSSSQPQSEQPVMTVHPLRPDEQQVAAAHGDAPTPSSTAAAPTIATTTTTNNLVRAELLPL